ncbi:hypothetical protein HMSSN139_25090 [Paenibacillus sp. HMSSN-139]|nr:hypothetical protein HMSSN139_25090 [Paenibacillus sp. HMSSN-139]
MSETYDLIIKNGRVVLPDRVARLDIAVSSGRIALLAEDLDRRLGKTVLEAEGQYVLPGMIDAHVHFNEPNFGHWEGFASGSAALAAGGCTTYIDMPLNGNPPTVSLPALALKAKRAAGRSAVDYAFWGGLVPRQYRGIGGVMGRRGTCL